MKKIISKWVWLFTLWVFWGVILFPTGINAEDMDVDWFNIMPKLKAGEVSELNQAITEIWSKWWEVWKTYNQKAQAMDTDTKKQIASWIMSWNTILNYLVLVVKFLSQLWLFVWAVFIMIAWYKYMVSVFNWGKLPTETVKNAIIWVIIVIFSFAIMKTLTSFIGLS